MYQSPLGLKRTVNTLIYTLHSSRRKISEIGDPFLGEQTSFLRLNILENTAAPTPVAFCQLTGVVGSDKWLIVVFHSQSHSNHNF